MIKVTLTYLLLLEMAIFPTTLLVFCMVKFLWCRSDPYHITTVKEDTITWAAATVLTVCSKLHTMYVTGMWHP